MIGSAEKLMGDARLWLLHTDGQTRVVIVVSFTESTREHSLEASNWETEGDVQPHEDISKEEMSRTVYR